jgi:hypothetical protein
MLKNHPDPVVAADLEETDLGTEMRKPYIGWLRGTGLAESRDGSGGVGLTSFGVRVASQPRLLDQPATQWLMHYHLAAPDGPGPEFWNEAISHFSAIGESFSVDDWLEHFRQSGAAEKSERVRFNVFKQTYVTGALIRLGMLSVDPSSKQVRVSKPRWACGADVFAYALIDHWQERWDSYLSVDLELVFEPGGVADVFMLNREQVDEYLGTLAADGLLDVFRIAPPYQITRRWADHKDQKNLKLGKLFDDGR